MIITVCTANAIPRTGFGHLRWMKPYGKTESIKSPKTRNAYLLDLVGDPFCLRLLSIRGDRCPVGFSLIDVLYTCYRCKTKDQIVKVRQRGTDEDILLWIEYVRSAVGEDHANYAPFCGFDICDLKIPVAKDIETNPERRIGDPI